jgi:hypothetical protein
VTEVAPHTLPSPVIDPADVQALVPGLSIEDATTAAKLATMSLESLLEPDAIPAPLPAKMYQATLTCAARIARSGDPAGQVVSESLGAYSVRRDPSTPADAAMYFNEDELKLLGFWAPRVYDVRTPAVRDPYPYDWFQRDLDLPP